METLLNTQKLERLTQKEIIRFYTHWMYHREQNPQSFVGNHYNIVEVSVNDMGTMTKVQVILMSSTKTRSYLYTDCHAQDYSCSNLMLEPI